MNSIATRLASIFVLSLCALAPRAAEPAEQDLVKQVNDAIEKGKKYLLTRQNSGGNWELSVESTAYPGGWTSLVILALIQSGVPRDDPAIVRGLDYLRTIDAGRTYAVALQTMAFTAAGYAKDLPLIQRNADWLVAARVVNEDPRKSGWYYGARGPLADGSNTQYALLGLHEAKQAGAKIDPAIWDWVRELYKNSQLGGAWVYRPGWKEGPSISMTAAGLCGLLISGMDASTGKETIRDGVVEGCGKYEDNRHVMLALDWLGQALPVDRDGQLNGGRIPHLYYTLYGIERAGRLSGQRFLGRHDWYRLGCDYLVRNQLADGHWEGGSSMGDGAPVLATCFAMLFLSKGRTPVLVSKLVHGPTGSTDWNNDRYDVRNLVEFAGKQLFKKPLAWQIFDARLPPHGTEAEVKRLAADLLQSPIVFLNGHQAPDFTDVNGPLLKEYVENGGFIFADACCSSERFFEGFKKEIELLFGDARFQLIPPSDAIWTASVKFISSPRDFELWGLRIGCRTAVVICRQDLSCWWEANDDPAAKGFNARDRERSRQAFELGANVVAYATGLEPPPEKGTKIKLIGGDPDQKTPPRGSFQAAQLNYDGDWKPAPNAMRNLMLALQEWGIKNVVLKPEEIGAASPDLGNFKFLYMHGSKGFQLDPREVDKLRFHLESGSLLLADACCGKKEFDASFRGLVEQICKGSRQQPPPRLEKIPLDDELFGKQLNGRAITQVRCRRLAADGKTLEPGFRDVEPELEGVKVNGRWVIVYSKYDIGCALEKTRASDCLGHDFESARRLGLAAVFYALKR